VIVNEKIRQSGRDFLPVFRGCIPFQARIAEKEYMRLENSVNLLFFRGTRRNFNDSGALPLKGF
jgi:hypothetical protein